jgi:hypothetical protein
MVVGMMAPIGVVQVPAIARIQPLVPSAAAVRRAVEVS